MFEIPADAVDCERAISAYNNIVDSSRARLLNETVRNYVMIFFNNQRRLLMNEARTKNRIKSYRCEWPLSTAFPDCNTNEGRETANYFKKNGLFLIKKEADEEEDDSFDVDIEDESY